VKNHPIDATLMSLLGLLALAGVVASGAGVEPVAGVLWAVLLSAAVVIVGSVLVGCRWSGQRRIAPALAASAFSLAVILSVAVTDWPLRVAYAWSRNSFDAVARRVRNGEVVATPWRAGLFTIRRAELSHHGIVCLWTKADPGGSTGFVECRRDHVPFNLWSMVALDDRWQFISED
jgi:hypothetical protein